ncbi:MAG: hypothetical protein RIT81_41755 [Deltaproteobacteria bacterium]
MQALEDNFEVLSGGDDHITSEDLERVRDGEVEASDGTGGRNEHYSNGDVRALLDDPNIPDELRAAARFSNTVGEMREAQGEDVKVRKEREGLGEPLHRDDRPKVMLVGKEAGTNGWMVQPFDKTKLLGVIEKLAAKNAA